jgi:hypothetical protein
MTSDSGGRREHLFVVRLWFESANDRGQWRGSVEHVDTGQRLYFASLSDMTEFIQHRLGRPGHERT